MPAFTPQPQSITALWLVLILPSHGRAEGWVDLGGWLQTETKCRLTDTYILPTQTQSTDRNERWYSTREMNELWSKWCMTYSTTTAINRDYNLKMSHHESPWSTSLKLLLRSSISQPCQCCSSQYFASNRDATYCDQSACLSAHMLTNPTPRSFTSSSQAASTDLPAPFLLSYSVFDFTFSLCFVSVLCARLSWPSRQLLSAR